MYQKCFRPSTLMMNQHWQNLKRNLLNSASLPRNLSGFLYLAHRNRLQVFYRHMHGRICLDVSQCRSPDQEADPVPRRRNPKDSLNGAFCSSFFTHFYYHIIIIFIFQDKIHCISKFFRYNIIDVVFSQKENGIWRIM